ncbi:imelysin family protein [Pelagibius litoralis]|uniref:Imelysin family protein n=1 Tax=Pelagibius litoralis TaxID=374515 RepID=A0A967KD92_9PROT|nr:imelysin family protein [Pelagibius litoralis]NIA70095.1 imelysin family protein [Pelagibius litoralis]
MKSRDRRFGVFVWIGLALAPGPVTAAPTVAEVDDFASFNEAAIEDYLLPRYEALAAAGEGLKGVLRRDCADGRLDDGASGQAYHVMMDAWMAVQHLRFGPSELFLRAERMQFWPDKRGSIGRRLSQLLMAADQSDLEPRRFAQGSVAIQGLPALERLLFDMPGDNENAFACDLAVRIGANLRDISTALLADWRDGPSAYAAVMRDASKGNAEYLDAKEASLQLAKSLHSALLLIVDFKLQRVLGDFEEAVKPKRAESWRSGRSLRNIRINLAAARTLYQDVGQGGFAALLRRQPGGPTLHVEIAAAFRHVEKRLASLPPSWIEVLAEPRGWQRVSMIHQDLRDLLALISGPFSQTLDLPLGFNSFDGD